VDPKLLVTVILFGPLIGAITAGLFGRFIPTRVSQGVTTGFLFLSALLSWIVFSQWTWGGLEPFTLTYLPFVHVGGFVSDWTGGFWAPSVVAAGALLVAAGLVLASKQREAKPGE